LALLDYQVVFRNPSDRVKAPESLEQIGPPIFARMFGGAQEAVFDNDADGARTRNLRIDSPGL
jgi:hypothetical protein